MNPRNFMFFDSKMKKNKKNTKASNHSRSLSAKSDIGKNSARVNPNSDHHIIPLTKKQKEIREAIEYRYKKSKMREYLFEQGPKKSVRKVDRSHSSQMEQYRYLQSLRVLNLRDFHEKQQRKNQMKKRDQQSLRKSIKNRLKIRTDSSLIMKTEGSEKSMDRLKFLRPYLNSSHMNSQAKSPAKKDDWKFISIQMKGDPYKSKSKFNKNEMKIKSHRTMTLQEKSRTKIKVTSVENRWEAVPKLKDLSKLHQKYKF